MMHAESSLCSSQRCAGGFSTLNIWIFLLLRVMYTFCGLQGNIIGTSNARFQINCLNLPFEEIVKKQIELTERQK